MPSEITCELWSNGSGGTELEVHRWNVTQFLQMDTVNIEYSTRSSNDILLCYWHCFINIIHQHQSSSCSQFCKFGPSTMYAKYVSVMDWVRVLVSVRDSVRHSKYTVVAYWNWKHGVHLLFVCSEYCLANFRRFYRIKNYQQWEWDFCSFVLHVPRIVLVIKLISFFVVHFHISFACWTFNIPQLQIE